MEYNRLNEDEYRELVGDLVKLTESLHERSQDVGDGRATIGYGYTFNRANNVEIWQNSGIELTQTEWGTLESIDAARTSAERTRIGLTFPRQLTAAEGDQLLWASLPEYEAPVNSLGMPMSSEKAAIVSVVYNRGAGSYERNMQPFRDAVSAGDRAEAWYELRYEAWGSHVPSEAGLRKRRYMESELFGLYDDPQNVSAEEAASVYRMFQLHRDRITGDERTWGVSIDGEPGTRRNLIALANRDYADLLADRGNVQTLAEILEPAKQHLLADLRQQHPEIADRLTDDAFASTSIHLDAGRDSVRVEVSDEHVAILNAVRSRHGEEIENHDLLIGQGGDDTLVGGRGNDVLIGGAGRDLLQGGEGHDAYVVGDGDIVDAHNQRGEIVWDGRRLTGGVRPASGSEDTYRSEDGRHAYRIDGADLVISNDAGQQITVRDFQPGNLGINLGDSLERDVAPVPGAVELHPLLLQSQAAVNRLDRDLGRTPDRASDCMSASLACLARENGFDRIDHVVLSRETETIRQGENVFVVQGRLDDPAHSRAYMKTDIAVHTPAADSLHRLKQLDEQLVLGRENRTSLQEQQQTVEQESQRRAMSI